MARLPSPFYRRETRSLECAGNCRGHGAALTKLAGTQVPIPPGGHLEGTVRTHFMLPWSHGKCRACAIGFVSFISLIFWPILTKERNTKLEGKENAFFPSPFLPGLLSIVHILENCAFENYLRTQKASKKRQWFASCFNCKPKEILCVRQTESSSENVSNIQNSDLNRCNYSAMLSEVAMVQKKSISSPGLHAISPSRDYASRFISSTRSYPRTAPLRLRRLRLIGRPG